MAELHFRFVLSAHFRLSNYKGALLVFLDFAFIIIASVAKHSRAPEFLPHCEADADVDGLVRSYFHWLVEHDVADAGLHIFIVAHGRLQLWHHAVPRLAAPVHGEVFLARPHSVNTEPHKGNVLRGDELNGVQALLVREVGELSLGRVHLGKAHECFRAGFVSF